MRRAARFFSFNKPADWHNGRMANMSLRSSGISIERTDKYSVYKSVQSYEIDGADEATDFAVGPGSKLYVLDSRAGLWVHDYENRHTEPLFSPGHQLFTNRSYLAAEGDCLYIADPGGENRISSVAPSNGQLLWTARRWNGTELYPLAAAADKGRHLYTVVPLDPAGDAPDSAEVPAGSRIAVLQWNSSGEVVRVFEHETMRLDSAASVRDLCGRFSLASAGEGEPVLLDSVRKTVTRFGRYGEEPAVTRTVQAGTPAGVAVDAEGAVYVGDGSRDGSSEDERFIFQYAASGECTAKVSGYRSRADKLLHDRKNRIYALDREKGVITLLELQSRTMTLADTGLPEAWYVSGELDSVEEETEWHKIELLADIPEETQIRFSCFATDERYGVLEGEVVDYSEYFGNPDIPLARKWKASRHLWSEPIVNPRDALLMNAKGRYLWYRLELAGSERTAPVVSRLRIHFPRQSPIVHLPSIYQEDPGGSKFLERFLALFGTFFAEMEEKIDKISSTFDPDGVAGPYLTWLSRWLALDIAESWDEPKLRTLMKRAPELYKLRGTRQGLSQMLHIYSGVEPFIVEQHQLKHMQESSELRQMFTRLYGDNPYCFCVMLPPECVRSDKQRMMVENIIEDQQPAYAEGRLVILQPWMHADMHTYIGINTVLSEPTLLTLDRQSSMPHGTVLIDVDRDKRIDIHTRLELDSGLE